MHDLIVFCVGGLCGIVSAIAPFVWLVSREPKAQSSYHEWCAICQRRSCQHDRKSALQ